VPIAAGEQTNAVAVAIDAASVIAAVSTAAANAARAATTTMPIVGLDLETDPVAIGMIASLARLGGNLTGFFFDFAEFRGKLLELLKEIIPELSSIAGDLGSQQRSRAIEVRPGRRGGPEAEAGEI
jgi:ABC-type uncharacterized transport system substrate-binding protein